MAGNEFEPQAIDILDGRLHALHDAVVDGRSVLNSQEKEVFDRRNALAADYTESATEYVKQVFGLLTTPKIASAIMANNSNKRVYSDEFHEHVDVVTINNRDVYLRLRGNRMVGYRFDTDPERFVRPDKFEGFVAGITRLCDTTLTGIREKALVNKLCDTFGEEKTAEIIEALKRANESVARLLPGNTAQITGETVQAEIKALPAPAKTRGRTRRTSNK